MPNTHATLASLFNDIASAIRQKKGESSTVKYVADEFPTAIASIPTGGGVTISSLTRSSSVWEPVNFSSGLVFTTEITKTFQLSSGVKYYLVFFDIILDPSNTSGVDGYSGQSWALIDETGTLVNTGHVGNGPGLQPDEHVTDVTVSKTGNAVSCSITVSKYTILLQHTTIQQYCSYKEYTLK